MRSTARSRLVFMHALILILMAPAVGHAADRAPEPVPPDVIKWFDEFAASGELRSDFDHEEYLDSLGIDAIDHIRTGDPVPLYRWDASFVRGETDGLDGIVTLNAWIAPVYINDQAAGTISASRESPDAAPDFFQGSVPVQDAGSLEDVAPDEFLVDEGPIDAWLAVSTDRRVRGVNSAGLRELPEPISLAEYAERTVERYADDLELPDGTDMAGGVKSSADLDASGDGMASNWAGMAALAGGVLAAVGVAVLYRRRRARRRTT